VGGPEKLRDVVRIEVRPRLGGTGDRDLGALLGEAHYGPELWGRWGLGYSLLGLDERPEANAIFAEALDLILSAPQIVITHLALIANGVAHTAAI
jgi:hypothetical protein